ncbi:short chain dehydrogenase reductase family protein [Cryptosporidium ubiquitum]|uniref:Short chain dehydrogenase reductase family protein n=1 Tax=Cryptosporidium ubiquitum TaxID=857276 RepID=A0A1J4MIU8_9CRYT|nr:short chain dehydrogenase reductase family protein [Cryptosporidium ubiquitum]OII72781.1 short chain dehydrogenase reductase family protein [Cryptosporidium ubiquitum]
MFRIMESQVSLMSYFELTLNMYLTIFLSLLWTLVAHGIKLSVELLFGIWILRRIFPFSKILFQRLYRILGLESVVLDKKDLTGNICIVTGGASGIGKKVSEYLVQCGATVIIADIQENRGRVAAYKINTNSSSSGFARYMYIDLSDEDSIRNFVNRFTYDYDRLHILVNNAGIGSGGKREEPKDCERHINKIFKVNYIGTFILTELLLPVLKNTKDSRIVNTCSPIHRFFGSNLRKILEYSQISECNYAYGASKAAILLYTLKLRRDAMGLTFSQTFQTDTVDGEGYDNFPWSTCVNPGSVNTRIFPNTFPYNIIYYLKWFLLDTKMGSQTTIFASVCPKEQATLYMSPYWLPGNGSWFIDRFADFLSIYVGPHFTIPNLNDDAALSAEYLYEWTYNYWRASKTKEVHKQTLKDHHK